MAEDTTTAETATKETEEKTETTTETENEQTTVGADARLPDDHPVMKTMQAEREARKKLEKDLADRKAADDAAAREAMDEHERAIAEARDAARTEVLSEVARDRMQDRVRIAAARKLNDPEDAVRLLDLDGLDPSSPDLASEIEAAIGSLIESKPYLAVTSETPSGSGDAGSRTPPAKPDQLTRHDLQSMSPEQIAKAKADGRLNTLLGRT